MSPEVPLLLTLLVIRPSVSKKLQSVNGNALHLSDQISVLSSRFVGATKRHDRISLTLKLRRHQRTLPLISAAITIYHHPSLRSMSPAICFFPSPLTLCSISSSRSFVVIFERNTLRPKAISSWGSVVRRHAFSCAFRRLPSVASDAVVS